MMVKGKDFYTKKRNKIHSSERDKVQDAFSHYNTDFSG